MNIKTVLLRDITELITKGTTPTSVGGKFTKSGINFLKVESISNSGSFLYDKMDFIDLNTHENLLKRSRINENDILFSIAGTIGRTAIATKDILPCNTNQAISIIRPNIKKIYPHFLLYCLKDTERLKKAYSKVVQSVQANLSLGELGSIEIPNFSLSDQKKISHVLRDLDNKIINNEKINQTLEEISKTLFKSWFIDFDPIKAKLKGVPTQLSKKISDLFPDSYDDSELGKIPKGWNVSTIGKSLKVVLGGTPSRKRNDYWNGTIPWINSGKINNFRITSPSEFITQTGYDNSSTKMLSKRSTLIAITGATLGQVSINEIDICANQSVIGIPPSKVVTPEFVYLWIKSSINKLISSQTGGAQQHINKNNVKEHLILIPSSECNIMFQKIVTPIFNKISKNTFENKILINLRDALLPKLISGEFKITGQKKEIKESIV